MLRNKGVYRLLTCRHSSRTGQLLVLLCVSLKDLEGKDQNPLWLQERERLANALLDLRADTTQRNSSSDVDSGEIASGTLDSTRNSGTVLYVSYQDPAA